MDEFSRELLWGVRKRVKKYLGGTFKSFVTRCWQEGEETRMCPRILRLGCGRRKHRLSWRTVAFERLVRQLEEIFWDSGSSE